MTQEDTENTGLSWFFWSEGGWTGDKGRLSFSVFSENMQRKASQTTEDTQISVFPNFPFQRWLPHCPFREHTAESTGLGERDRQQEEFSFPQRLLLFFSFIDGIYNAYNWRQSPRPRERHEAQERGSEILKAAEGYPPKKATWAAKRMERRDRKWEKEKGGGGGVGVGESIWEGEDKYQFRNSDKDT